MDRLEKLKELEADLRALMSESDYRSYAPLAKQYRDTLREIDALENGEDDHDEIASIILRHR